MSNKAHSVIPVVLLMLVIVLSITAWKSCNRNSDILKGVEKIVKVKDTASISYYKDLYDKEHAVAEEISTSKDVLEATYGSRLDSIKKELRIKASQVKELNAYILSLSGNVKSKVDTVIVYVDSNGIITKKYPFKYSDNIINIHNGFVAVKDTSVVDVGFDYYANLSVQEIKYQKRLHKFLFIPYGNLRTYVDLKSDNEGVKIRGVEKITVEVPQPSRFGVSTFLGYGYSVNNTYSMQPILGVGISYTLIKFKK